MTKRREIKYLICPGYVSSKNDNQLHYISAGKLMSLYQVNPSQCLVHRYDDNRFYHEDLITLSPRRDGNYQNPQLLQGETDDTN